MSKVVLVTGAAGQLGSQMRCVAQASGNTYIFTGTGELDISNYDAVSAMIADRKVDVILNCAAYTAVDKAQSDVQRANEVNNIAVGNLARAAKESGATLIHISTDYVFDGAVREPYTEDAATSPLCVYGQTKLAGEQQIVDAGCDHIIIRTSWLYSSFGSNFVKTMLRLMSERETISVVCDQVGAPTYAKDLAEAIYSIIEHDQISRSGLYHFSNGGHCSWYEFAQAICSMSGSRCDVNSIASRDYHTDAQRPIYTVLDTTKFQTTFGIPIKEWRSSLRECIEELKSLYGKEF